MNVTIRFDNIRKDFGAVRVLHGVSFELQPGLESDKTSGSASGKTYGLLGENGAGKSTLMKILAGYESITEGELVIDGESRRFSGSRQAETCGIVLIHQEFNLAEHLTIAQNIFLGHEKRKGWLLDDVAMRAEAASYLAQVGLDVSPDTKVSALIVAEKQLVEIAKALSRKARLLIMDEPSATLTSSETQKLFTLMAQLKQQGVTIIYISHKLDEIESNTDEVIIMRDGRFITREPTASLSRHQMANLMVGRDVSDMFPAKAMLAADAPVRLKVDHLTVPGWTSDLNFEVRAGEILGFAGLVGAGRTEAMEAIIGLRPRSSGQIAIDGDPLDLRNPRQAMQHGLTYLSEDRKGKGLHVDLGLRENLTIMTLERYCHPWLDLKSEKQALTQALQDFNIRAGNPQVKASMLSGGNQQKLALAKYLHAGPRVVILDEPTRGVDVGAKRDIYFLIHKLAAEGRAVIVISSELIELIGLCHRVAVMRAGILQTTLANDQLSEEELISHATGTR
ncbi:MAG: sugar ABC transporter ATP-binding protein [Collimonas sp.]|uniref:sugar ABC transporter ATP-binding protein n=1 Tax=Collimonas sp. TaxID=1963772 RepID=UPI003263EFEC